MPKVQGEAALAVFRAFAARVRYEDGKLIWVSVRVNLKGKECGWVGEKNYLSVRIKGYGRTHLHRLIFFMHHGYLPKIVDHIDGDIRNNRIENLRAADHQKNIANSKLYSTNKSGHRGVRMVDGKWHAGIKHNGKAINLGSFATIADAIVARRAAEVKYQGEFARAAVAAKQAGKEA